MRSTDARTARRAGHASPPVARGPREGTEGASERVHTADPGDAAGPAPAAGTGGAAAPAVRTAAGRPGAVPAAAAGPVRRVSGAAGAGVRLRIRLPGSAAAGQ